MQAPLATGQLNAAPQLTAEETGTLDRVIDDLEVATGGRVNEELVDARHRDNAANYLAKKEGTYVVASRLAALVIIVGGACTVCLLGYWGCGDEAWKVVR